MIDLWSKILGFGQTWRRNVEGPSWNAQWIDFFLIQPIIIVLREIFLSLPHECQNSPRTRNTRVSSKVT